MAGRQKMPAKGKKARPPRSRENAAPKMVVDKDDHSRPSTVILEGVVNKLGTKSSKRVTRQQGLSLSVKFAILISFVSIFLCLFCGLVVYYKVETSMKEEIDRKGIALLKSVANIGKEFVSQYKSSYEEYERAKKEKENDKANEYTEKCTTIRKTFQQYLDDMVNNKESAEIYNITVDAFGGVYTLISGGDARTLSAQGTIYSSTEDYSISVIEGTLGVGEIRGYQMKMKSGINAYVFLSKQDINDLMNSLLSAIAMITLIAMFIGVGSSFILSSLVTKPIKKLIKDVEIVANGKLSHKTVASSRDEVGLLARAFNVMTQNLQMAHETELDNKAREHELQIAQEIQNNLLPKEIPKLPNYNIAAFYHPSKEVGGDYYDFLPIGDDYLGIVVADVAGKGVPGSMIMTMTRSLVRMEAVRNVSPSKTLTEVNKVVAQDIRRGMFVTAIYCVLVKSTGELYLTSAGHNPGVIWRAAEKRYELINTKGIALGFDKGPIFERTIEETKTILNKGDRIVLYTDGVPEAMSPKNEEYGDDRFYDLIAKCSNQNPEQLVDTIVKSLEKWKGSGPQSDDITIVTLDRI